MEDEKYIGYIKYSGESVKDGLFDMRKSAEALLGFDEILRYFILQEDPTLKEIDFEIPVRIRKGSWEALIPTGLAIWFAKDYLSSIAKEAGKNGFLDSGPAKDLEKIFKVSIKSAQWIIKIASHVGSLTKRKFENIKFRNNNEQIGIPNDNNEYLYVPKKYFDLFEKCPENIFAKNSKIIEKERILEIGLYGQENVEKVIITEKEKSIFYTQSNNNEIILPELKHDQFVELDGEITRATESTNSIGFRYKEHTLVCKPKSGDIAQFKNQIISPESDHFFPKIKINGKVSRKDKNGDFKEKKPQIFFSKITPLITEEKNLKLL